MVRNDFWKAKLTPFDAKLVVMIESLTGKPCEPKNGGNHYFIVVDYSDHNDPDYIAAIWDAIEGRVGSRLISMKDQPEFERIIARIGFYREPCKDAAFIPKIEQQ